MPSLDEGITSMSAEDSELEKTEPASQRRLEDARNDGDIARSPEVSAFAVTMSSLAVMWFSGPAVMDGLKRMMARGLTIDSAVVREPAAMTERLLGFSADALVLGAPILAVTVLAAIVAPMALGGWSFVPSAAGPKFDRINPMQGLGRMFSVHSLLELGKALLKAGLIGAVACIVLWKSRDSMMDLAGQSFADASGTMAHLVMVSTFSIAAVLSLIAAVDVPMQLWQYAKKLRMTKEDLKREHKESEGDPHVKAAMRAMQREAAKKRMMADVPKADVIVTNPTHYAVALKYDETMRAPTVIAKGVDLTAARIRGVAETNNIPILEAPPLARALYTHTDIGSQIPEKLYTAVAEVLAYVFQLKSYGLSGLKPLGEVEVPADLDPLTADAKS
jgi:flagellar biosynthetic protein FlhB